MKSIIPIYDIENFKAYKNDGILVSRFGHYAQQHQHLHSVHRHTFYHLVFFTAGSGTQQIDFKQFPVKPGLIYFMIPGQVHSWDFKTSPDGYILNFSSDYLSSFLLNSAYLDKFSFFSGEPTEQVIQLSEVVQAKATSIFEDMLKEGKNEVPLQDDLVKTLVIKLFIEIARAQVPNIPLTGNAYNHTLLKSFQKLIATNYAQLRLPKQYAALLYITPNHLNALCNDFLGVSAGRLIRDRVILEAKRLLINLELRIAEIADQLSFADQSYFIKFFKKYEGITPEKFRKLNTISNGSKSRK
jgi:AraC family transcriptional activator of pobA